ncbi:MAG: NUDIX domain-containing protein [Propioniciclava sp.]|uniref:NUDIX hydrolase n=1 Tax=Propioniciclava sp. TaxID=2038686 RepID=UPI0039E6E88A
MEIVGVEIPGGAPALSFTLGHGEDPYQVAWEAGYRVLRPLSASGTLEDLVVTLLITRHGRRIVPRGPQRVRNSLRPGLDVGEPVVRQRLAAYALVVSDRGLLATEFSDRTAVPGMWGLPGGGIDPGENPSTTVQREVFEETGQVAEVTRFLDVQSDHWIGHSPTGVVEDFHAVRLIYAARCEDPGDPVVHDRGGTTASCRWVSADAMNEVAWINGSRALLGKHASSLLRTVPRRASA